MCPSPSRSIALPHRAIGKAHGDQYTVGAAIDPEGTVWSDTRPHVTIGVENAIVAMAVHNWHGASVDLRESQRPLHMYLVIRRIEHSV